MTPCSLVDEKYIFAELYEKINTPCGKSAEFCNVTAGGTYSYQRSCATAQIHSANTKHPRRNISESRQCEDQEGNASRLVSHIGFGNRESANKTKGNCTAEMIMVKLYLCTLRRHRGVEVWLHSFLNSAQDRLVQLRARPLYPR